MNAEIHSWGQTILFAASILTGLVKFAWMMSKHFDKLCGTVDRLDGTVSKLENTIHTHAEILPEQERRIAKLEGKFESMEARLKQ
jgi:TolA-binding protein